MGAQGTAHYLGSILFSCRPTTSQAPIQPRNPLVNHNISVFPKPKPVREYSLSYKPESMDTGPASSTYLAGFQSPLKPERSVVVIVSGKPEGLVDATDALIGGDQYKETIQGSLAVVNGKQQREWNNGVPAPDQRFWDTLAWQPDGAVRCSYRATLDQSPGVEGDYFTWAECDLDNDGQWYRVYRMGPYWDGLVPNYPFLEPDGTQVY